MTARRSAAPLSFGIEAFGPTGGTPPSTARHDAPGRPPPATATQAPGDGTEWIPRTLTPEDEYRHEPIDDPMWREGAYISFYDEASGLFGNSWMGIRPQVGRAEAHFVVWDESGEVVHRFTNWGGFTIPREQPRDPFQYGPVKYRCIEPFREWSYQFDDGECRLDLTWTAINPVYDYPWEGLTQSRHVEHCGNVEGTLRLDGRTVQISGTGQRDRAWGMRNHSDYGRWIWICPQFGDDFAANIGTVAYRGEPYVFGFLWKDGRQGELTNLELTTDFSFFGGPPDRAVARIEDDLGRSVKIDVEPTGMYPNAFGDVGKMGLIFIGQARYIADGRVGSGVCDYCWTDVDHYPKHIEVARK